MVFTKESVWNLESWCVEGGENCCIERGRSPHAAGKSSHNPAWKMHQTPKTPPVSSICRSQRQKRSWAKVPVRDKVAQSHPEDLHTSVCLEIGR